MAASAPTPDSVFYEGNNWGGAISRGLQGIDHVGRGRPEWNEATGRYRVPTFVKGADGSDQFKGYTSLDAQKDSRWNAGELLAREEQARERRSEQRLITEQRRQEGRSDARHNEQLTLLRGDQGMRGQQITAAIEAQTAQIGLSNRQLQATIDQNKASNDLQGKALLYQAYNQGQQNQIALAQMQESSRLREMELGQRAAEMKAGRKSALITAALQMMGGGRS